MTRGNSFSNGECASGYGSSNLNGQGPAAINDYTGTRLNPWLHWWLV